MPQNYLGTADIAAMFAVDSKTVAQWRIRYDDFPAPDALVGTSSKPVAGWHPRRRQEFKDWYASRPGQGSRSDLKETK